MSNKTLIIILILIIIIFITSIIFSLLNFGSNKIISGVNIANINVSKMTKENASNSLKKIATEKNNEITLKYITENGEYEKKLDLSTLNINFNIENSINNAYNIGRNGNIFQSNLEIAKTMFFKENIDLNISLDEKMLNNIISDVSSNLPNKLIQSGYYVEDKSLIITKGTSGIIVDKESLTKELTNYIKDFSNKNTTLSIPIKYVEPEKIDIDKIHSEIFKKAKDAYFEEEPFKVYPEVKGVDFDVDKAKKMLDENSNDTEITIALKYTTPKTTLKKLKINLFPDELSTFFTQYDEKNKNRNTNLKIAASKIDGIILLPGEEFSYNKVVGARSIEAGYKEAKIYQNGQVVDGLGGGICQISSTLYNAAVCANLDITERFNHQFITSYVKPGQDATVAYGSKDLKFKNNRTYPIRIDSYVSNGMATINIYGIKEKDEKQISIDVETISTIPYETKYIKDSSLSSNEEKLKQRGSDGIIVNSYKITKENGNIVSKELLSKDTYKPLERIIAKSAN
ncbi:MAG: VanW family protein [Clostridia bacterium]|nr:VanW family protein [Clostridia bacterium]